MKHRKNTKQNTTKTPSDLQNRQEGGFISYYHDRYDLEADAVLHFDNGRYALIEFKLGSREIEEAKDKSKEITPEQEKLWWVPIETLITMIKGYQLTGRQECLEWFNRVHDYV